VCVCVWHVLSTAGVIGSILLTFTIDKELLTHSISSLGSLEIKANGKDTRMLLKV
jgi:hypothetical protein